jgi:uncharacterized alkaline shock family protein YloU
VSAEGSTAINGAAPEGEAGDRGTLVINQSVVRKVAERAADRVPGTTKVERKVAGLGMSTHGAIVKVAGEGNDVDLSVDLSLRYPVAIGEVVDDVRSKVTEEIHHITSYHVRSFDVSVSALVPDARSRVG